MSRYTDILPFSGDPELRDIDTAELEGLGLDSLDGEYRDIYEETVSKKAFVKIGPKLTDSNVRKMVINYLYAGISLFQDTVEDTIIYTSDKNGLEDMNFKKIEINDDEDFILSDLVDIEDVLIMVGLEEEEANELLVDREGQNFCLDEVSFKDLFHVIEDMEELDKTNTHSAFEKFKELSDVLDEAIKTYTDNNNGMPLTATVEQHMCLPLIEGTLEDFVLSLEAN